MTAATLLRPAALHAALLTADSATAVLEAACGGPVRVRRLAPDATEIDAAQHTILQPSPDEAVTLRRVHLICRGQMLSEAELRYVPARLPPALTVRLHGTDLPFGRIVRHLGLRRMTLSARICSQDEPWALIHHAVLAPPGAPPLALVHERYPWSLFS